MLRKICIEKLMLQNWTFSAFNGDIFKKNKIKKIKKRWKFMFKNNYKPNKNKNQFNRDFIGMDESNYVHHRQVVYKNIFHCKRRRKKPQMHFHGVYNRIYIMCNCFSGFNF